MRMSSIMTTKRKSTITAPTYTSTSSSARNSAPSSIHSIAALAKDQVHDGGDRAARAVIAERRDHQHGGQQVEKDSGKSHGSGPWAQRWSVFGPAAGDVGFVAVAHGEQHVFGEVQVAALFTVVFVDAFPRSSPRAAFHRSRRKCTSSGRCRSAWCGAVLALVRFDGDGHRRAHRFAQCSALRRWDNGAARAGHGNAPTSASFRGSASDLALEEILSARQALEQFGQHQAAEEILIASISCLCLAA